MEGGGGDRGKESEREGGKDETGYQFVGKKETKWENGKSFQSKVPTWLHQLLFLK